MLFRSLLGRPASWALVDGEPGMARLHEEMRAELGEAMRLAGCTELSQLPQVLAAGGSHPI